MSDFLGDHSQLLKVHQTVHAGVVAWEGKKKHGTHVHTHTQSQPSNCFKGEKRFMFEAECEMSTLTLSPCLSSASQLWLESLKELAQFGENFFFPFLIWEAHILNFRPDSV